MLVEQHLFSLYRTIIKIPTLLLLTAAAVVLLVAYTQIAYMSETNRSIDLAPVLFDYRIQKYGQRQAKEQPDSHQTNTDAQEENTEISDWGTSQDYAFVNDATFLHFVFSQQESPQITLNYTYLHNGSNLPSMYAIQNENLVYMGDKSQEYLLKHGISYDLITLPALQIGEPTLAYYFQLDLQINEILMTSFRSSYLQQESAYRSYLLKKNISGTYQQISELHLVFFYLSGSNYQYIKENFFNYLSMEQLPSFFLISIYGGWLLFVLVIASAFMGLFLRYTIYAFYNVLLVFCDGFWAQQGWTHHYMRLLSQRWARNRMTTLWMVFFYCVASVGMLGLLAFGAYFILAKLVGAMLPLLTEEYTFFFMKTLLAIEVFHLLMSRTRTTTKFFPIFSYIINFATLLLCSLKRIPCMLMLLNLNLTLQLLIFLIFVLLEKTISQAEGLRSEYVPSPNKPRMLFYAGFDISWEKSIAPLWTYFTSWFDYSHFSESERCFLERDFQLLYGRMFGLDERQEIPEEDYELQPVQPLLTEPSNQLRLIEQ